MEEKAKKILPILLAVMSILLFIIAGVVVLYFTGHIYFDANGGKKVPTNDVIDSTVQDSVVDNNTSNTDSGTVNDNASNSTETKTNATSNTNATSDNAINKATTNMTNEEVFKLWEKIKGNWAKVEYRDDLCVGNSVEINHFIKFAKFNSDGITSWSVVAYNKIDENQYKVSLMTPVDLVNRMSGDVVAHYSTATIDISKIDQKILRINNTDYQYVGENNAKVENFQYIDGGFSQDKYCEWYKENNK